MPVIATISRSSSRGFTLVEMLMAMLVMTVGLLGLLQSVNVAYQQSLKDKLRKEATQVAEARMHDWCSQPFKKITGPPPPDERVERAVAGGYWRYEVHYEPQPVGTGTVKLRVGVTWSVKGVSNSHEIFTLRTRRDGE
ncbi:prepilin-type N-terminal cleavage/methylation domain-containing protein [Geomonas subterranea]|uniref:Prepilin-type N-terminal cleavage/methylation domain-containing protein n=1 Tax=Geomonas subterranea TaxID=2847989 RepID=A0ABX8LLA0_9BACT|nr:prepilin-type N-terminal cleavage/methylation domain-containing protein [Geomonas subterranea]QXE91480.1 prepilin-type N-terminal cleavage/methylation domain-containing protein [Geomonas subterranea]QXM10432.1 prepilin-type N-terminal cleavage/methylation domain-containing protein [Geomonas subterranea]